MVSSGEERTAAGKTPIGDDAASDSDADGAEEVCLFLNKNYVKNRMKNHDGFIFSCLKFQKKKFQYIE